MDIRRVIATDATKDLIQTLQKTHGQLLFHQSGGCCDGSSPMCLKQDDLLIGNQDVLLGNIEGIPFYMHKNQYEYWKHTQLIIDVVKGQGGMFSLEGVLGYRFLTRSRVFTKEEYSSVFSNLEK